MNTELSNSCRCFGCYDDGNIIGFIAILHQPHGSSAKLKRVHRLVVLPDYQGIGIGYAFLTTVAKAYVNEGWTFSIVTSAKNLIWKLSKSNEWQTVRCGYCKCVSTKSAIDYRRKSIRNDCKTASFKYKG